MPVNIDFQFISMQKNVIIVIFLIIGLVVLVFLPQLRDGAEDQVEAITYEQRDGKIYLPEASPIRDRITIGASTKDTLTEVVSAPATVEANPAQRAQIFPPAGGRIVDLYVGMGQEVRRGQRLFTLYSPDIAEVQTEFINSRSALAQSERALNRVKELHRRGIAPERELEEARTEFEIAKAELEGASLKLDIIGLTEEEVGKPLIVRSPINGRIVSLQVAQGEYISEPEEPLMLIADLSNVWITARIQEKDIRFIHRDAEAEATFAAYPGEVYSGNVLFIGDLLDEETRTTKVTVALPNEDYRLKPGMFANVKFKTPAAAMVVVPPRAVLQRRDFNYVYVEKEPHLYERREVRTGSTIDGKLVILSGLEAGERIIVENAVLLP